MLTKWISSLNRSDPWIYFPVKVGRNSSNKICCSYWIWEHCISPTNIHLYHNFVLNLLNWENNNFLTFKVVTSIYKIAKIVRALWLAERRVCMRVCKHGCDVKLFCFSWTKKVFEFKTRQGYFIYPFLHWLKLGKSLQTSCVNFFSLKLTF